MLDRHLLGKGTTVLNKKDFDSVPTLKMDWLPNTDMYPSVFQFKFQGMDGSWYLVDIIHVKNKDEVETGVNFIVARIEDEKPGMEVVDIEDPSV